jgi:hypothetical protein
MPRIKDRHHTDVLVDGDIIHHTYKGKLWKAVYTNGTFIDTENSASVYYTPTEFANSHLAVKTGVNGLRVCKVEREGKLVAIANLFAASAPAPIPATAATTGGPPKPKMTFQSMKKQAAAAAAATSAPPPKVSSETTASPPRKRKPAAPCRLGGGHAAPKKTTAVASAIIAPPPIIKTITARMVESKDEPLEIFEVEDIVVEEICADDVKYYKDARGETLYIYDDGQVGPPIKHAEEQDS